MCTSLSRTLPIKAYFDTPRSPLNTRITIVLALCFTTIIKTFQLYLTVDKPKILSLNKVYSVHTPEIPFTQLERVICCFWLVLDLVLVFVGFWLALDLRALVLFTP